MELKRLMFRRLEIGWQMEHSQGGAIMNRKVWSFILILSLIVPGCSAFGLGADENDKTATGG